MPSDDLAPPRFDKLALEIAQDEDETRTAIAIGPLRQQHGRVKDVVEKG